MMAVDSYTPSNGGDMFDETLPQPVGGNDLAKPFRHLRWKVRPQAKRLFDVLSAIILIVIVAPVICLITLIILLSGQVPFYPHTRIGLGGREFGCLKFTTMHRNADVMLAQLLERDPIAKHEWETNRKLQRDPRVTLFGAFLRTTSLDELPQLLNILVGQMSLVGPRPVTRDEFSKFYGPSEAAAYSSVRPGLTGLWQVSGRSEVGYENRVELDTLYVESLSMRTDLAILVRTIHVVLSRRGAW
jgi:exopolysaccharide production protein ExoY